MSQTTFRSMNVNVARLAHVAPLTVSLLVNFLSFTFSQSLRNRYVTYIFNHLPSSRFIPSSRHMGRRVHFM